MKNPIEKITISGFRGILHPIELDFTKGDKVRSMLVYGRNGTGKSSITDAFEWFHTESVAHLRREGAKERVFPHRDAKSGDTFVEIEFSASNFDTSRLLYDTERITMPKPVGDIEAFRAEVPHPFYIRYDDLKTFVFETQAKKYDQLANLMGFSAQVEFQESLRKVKRDFQNKVEVQEKKVSDREKELRHLLDVSSISDYSVVHSMVELFSRQGLENPKSISDLESAKDTLAERIQNDPTAKRISALSEVIKQLSLIDDLSIFTSTVNNLLDRLNTFASKQAETVNSLLVNVYESGKKYIEDEYEDKEAVNTCPLCGQHYEGDLSDHVLGKLEQLKDLRSDLTDLRNRREESKNAVTKQKRLLSSFRAYDFSSDINVKTDTTTLEEFQAYIRPIVENLSTFVESLDEISFSDAESHVQEIRAQLESLRARLSEISTMRTALHRGAKDQKQVLSENRSKKTLAEDHSKLVSVLDKRTKLNQAKKRYSIIASVRDDFGEVVDKFAEVNSKDVTQRFNEISADVKTFFEVIERDTDGLGDPEIELTTGETRGVYLKVHFHGQDERPAYKYLSESQLNSFGLALFLASAKRFNPDFPFIVLDDVINSYDAYKRTKLIDLFKDELPDHQVLLLTHDDVWTKQISEQFKQWKRIRFVDWGYGSGPQLGNPSVGLEYIEDELDDDRGPEAGRDFGEFLERHLQWLCDSFEAKIKYNAQNTYTLHDLFQAFLKRVKSKLSSAHPLYKALKSLFDKQGFRNYCAHWKNPITPYQAPEIRRYVNMWRNVDEIVRCDACERYPSYDRRNKRFQCGCDELTLTKRNN